VRPLAEARHGLEKLGPVTPGDLVRPFVEWLDYLQEVVGYAVEAIGFPQEFHADLHVTAVALSRTLDRAADLVAMYTESHVGGVRTTALGVHKPW
jgi:hypothetical protein